MFYKICILSLLMIFGIESQMRSLGQESINAVVTDKQTGEPIPYVSIGFRNKPLGTVTDTLGKFDLTKIRNHISDGDTVVFSRVGYLKFQKVWVDFIKSDQKVTLIPDENILPTLVISKKPFKVETYGRGPSNIIFAPKAYTNMPQISDERGREQVTILKVDKDILLRQLNVLIHLRKENNITFRMNIYNVKDGSPDRSILSENVIFNVKGPKKTGISNYQKIDLSPYKIHLKGYKEIALGIEIINRELEPGDTTKTAFYIPSFPSPLKSSFYRLKSQSPWEKVGSSYLIASIEASVMKKGDYKEDIADSDSLGMSGIKKHWPKMLYGNNIDVGKRIDIGDAEIYYEVYGSGEPLLLLHGNGESINSFREQIEPLSRQFKVIAVDSRGQGNSINRFKGDYTYELFASDMKRLLDSLGLEKVNVLGWSDGGNTGLAMSIRYPDYVKKLAVMGANAFSGENAIDAEVIKIFKDRSQKLNEKSDDELVNQKKLADLVLHQPNITEQQLETIKVPVLVMAGENDVIKKQHTLFVKESIPDAQLEIFKGGDHYAPLKMGAIFNNRVINFFSEKQIE